MSSNATINIVELNVGGVFYSTSRGTLTSVSGSKLARMFADEDTVLKDSKVVIFFLTILRVLEKEGGLFPSFKLFLEKALIIYCTTKRILSKQIFNLISKGWKQTCYHPLAWHNCKRYLIVHI